MSLERADKLGMVTSTLCAVHCAAGALLAGATGIGRIFADESLEMAFVSVAVVVALGSLSAGYKKHRHAPPLVLGLAGVLAVTMTRLVEFSSESSEVLLSVVGAGALILAHWMNLRELRRREACCVPAVGHLAA